MLKYVLALVSSICLGVVGQLLLKFSALRGGETSLFLRPTTLLGLGIYFLTALLYIFALKRIPLSVAYPSVAVSYVAVTLFAHLIWQEPLGLKQAVALGLICCGVILLVRPS